MLFFIFIAPAKELDIQVHHLLNIEDHLRGDARLDHLLHPVAEAELEVEVEHLLIEVDVAGHDIVGHLEGIVTIEGVDLPPEVENIVVTLQSVILGDLLMKIEHIMDHLSTLLILMY